MNEKLIEKKLREEVKKRGGLALKFQSPYHRGIPDRIVLMPGGKMTFVELKTTGKKPTRLQQKSMDELTALGFQTRVIDDRDKLDNYLKELDHAI